jgi:hypothetical protein
MNNRKNEARKERMQQRLEAGSMAEHFPEVANIVINMTYKQNGAKSILRVFNFYPASYAFFRLNCLSRDCIDGGFDLTQVITSMISNRREVTNGDLSCESSDTSAKHSDIVYEVAIQYA